jgi:MarR-like DNA-binding transcriptional regulator SgrR of sgrS sRNA
LSNLSLTRPPAALLSTPQRQLVKSGAAAQVVRLLSHPSPFMRCVSVHSVGYMASPVTRMENERSSSLCTGW